jgi:hypothetical protein
MYYTSISETLSDISITETPFVILIPNILLGTSTPPFVAQKAEFAVSQVFVFRAPFEKFAKFHTKCMFVLSTIWEATINLTVATHNDLKISRPSD